MRWLALKIEVINFTKRLGKLTTTKRLFADVFFVLGLSSTFLASQKADAARALVPQASWNTESPLITPGPSTEFGNFGKAITTDASGYVDVVWLQSPSTSDTDGALGQVGGSILFAQSGNEGQDWTNLSLSTVSTATGVPKIASAGPNIYVVWSQRDVATASPAIVLLRGVRNGSSVQWGTPLVISNAPAGASATYPVVAAYGDAVHVAWSDTRNAGVSNVYYTGSLNNGGAWSTPIPIAPVNGFNSWTPSIAAYSNTVYIAWTDTRFGGSDCSTNAADCHDVLYFRSSSDSGANWGTETELTCNASIYTYAPSLFVENGAVHIAYFQGDPFPPGPMNLYYLRGINSGATFAACSGTQGTLAPINVQYPSGDTVLSAWRPNISVSNGVVYMVWWGELTDNYATGQAKIYYSTSSNGVTWAAATSLTPQSSGSTYRSISPNIALSPTGSTIYTIWDDHRNDTNALDSNYQVFFISGSLAN